MKKICLCLVLAILTQGTLAWAAPLSNLPSLAPVAEKAGPAVVNISAEKVAAASPTRSPLGDDDIFNRFFGPFNQPERRAKSLGSGFIFDPSGFIITNNHVIEGTENIKVKLSSGEELDAEIVGRDPKTDLALIKVKKKGTYPHLTLGDSSALKIGDWVMAIGNPFGLDHTVTAGILSARSRAIGAGPYDDFLQTDASINPGNSGGPLLNLSGEVIGINTAIVSGASGIGFAIPANLAKGVINQLKDTGRVVRGWMGVVIQKVTPNLAKSYGLSEPRGALVGDIDPTGPGVAAKLKRGDIILKFNGEDVKEWQDLPIIVANTTVGKKVDVVVYRDKKEVTLSLTVAELAEEEDLTNADSATDTAGKLGLTLKKITPEMVKSYRLANSNGLFISKIDPGSPAAEAGLSAGDVLLEVNNTEVKTIANYRKLVSAQKKDEIIRFLIKRGGNTLFYAVTVPE